MAAESAALSDPHRDGAKNPAEQLQDVPLVAAHSHKSKRALHRSSQLSVAPPASTTKKTLVTSEKTPLVLKIDTSRHSQSVEEVVHPLPWFRSPEWSRRSPLLDKDRAAARQKRGRGRGAPASPRAWWWCFGDSSSNTARARDVELGYSSSHRRALAATTHDSDGFRQCIQFLVALVIVVALALIFMVIFEPFKESSATAAAAAAAAEGDGGW